MKLQHLVNEEKQPGVYEVEFDGFCTDKRDIFLSAKSWKLFSDKKDGSSSLDFFLFNGCGREICLSYITN